MRARNTLINQHQKGYVTLISVLVVGAIGVTIAISLLLLGLGSVRTSFVVQKSYQSRALANSCAKEALQQIRDSESYDGSDSLNYTQGSCEYNILDQGGENRTIQANGTVESVVKKVVVEIDQINPTINVVSWYEVVDF